MSSKTFKTTDISHEDLAMMWEEQHERRRKAEAEVRRLEKDSKYWRNQAEELE